MLHQASRIATDSYSTVDHGIISAACWCCYVTYPHDHWIRVMFGGHEIVWMPCVWRFQLISSSYDSKNRNIPVDWSVPTSSPLFRWRKGHKYYIDVYQSRGCCTISSFTFTIRKNDTTSGTWVFYTEYSHCGTNNAIALIKTSVPSDPRKNHPQIMDHIQSITTKQVQIASPFLFTAIGVGDGIHGKGKSKVDSNNFSNTNPNKYPILPQMVQTAQYSGATSAHLKVLYMSCTSFGQTFSSVATSISTSMTSQSSSLSSPRQFCNSMRGGFRTICVRDDDDDDNDEIDNTGSDLQQHAHHRDSRSVPRESITKRRKWYMKWPRMILIFITSMVWLEKYVTFPTIWIWIFVHLLPFYCNIRMQGTSDTRYVAAAKGAFGEGN